MEALPHVWYSQRMTDRYWDTFDSFCFQLQVWKMEKWKKIDPKMFYKQSKPRLKEPKVKLCQKLPILYTVHSYLWKAAYSLIMPQSWNRFGTFSAFFSPSILEKPHLILPTLLLNRNFVFSIQFIYLFRTAMFNIIYSFNTFLSQDGW